LEIVSVKNLVAPVAGERDPFREAGEQARAARPMEDRDEKRMWSTFSSPGLDGF
jgi:hypothetical protein